MHAMYSVQHCLQNSDASQQKLYMNNMYAFQHLFT